MIHNILSDNFNIFFKSTIVGYIEEIIPEENYTNKKHNAHLTFSSLY